MRSIVLAVVLASATAVACGGASDSGLFGGPGSLATDLDAGGTADTGTTGHGGLDASGGGDTGASTGGDTGGGASDGGVNPLPDTGTVDATPIVDANPPPPPNPGVYCGDGSGNATYCKVGTACCVKNGNGIPGGGSGASCETTAVPFCTGVAVDCDSDDDCNGQVCCGTLVNSSRYTAVRCQATCDTQSDTQVHFCDPNAPTDVCAADGLQCVESGILPGYYVCAN